MQRIVRKGIKIVINKTDLQKCESVYFFRYKIMVSKDFIEVLSNCKIVDCALQMMSVPAFYNKG